ncbi:aminoacyl-tRNA hydrolase [Chryseobacterium carnipullorum]|uniref:Aminoacyl-tRNA hydrolase n=1 Tax=Chryseobacterium carnipullorum TaxID=1124835 RepID=A0A376DQ91_CHRCU|nr:alternative ribosome rescue aminoacyl-tRNA hydrolase ArfB [Chryseobacterium carnipullorum]MDN5396487.1 aminoacyl-tRNA hydrolase [Chryseobacterium sp.]AZA48564.1 aminoacyl-tRNA hydrolase [Chryseobacterium carnipullorum]AZA63487.1 aminoacyl-tRNA hydrolase [Chryseobacterium carnipullorum]MDN5422630.1 aminoacyl-tRNA hydrolase [Chryseobacterium sp.]MDN5476966.1 aminoacyl-tRNA hydrolase [Chryseobacterium sp.]
MKDFSKELSFKTSRSSGAGGQNVNKVETAVTVLWLVDESEFFNEYQKGLIRGKLKNRINADGYMFLTVSESRTQLMNKNKAIEKIIDLVDKALIVPKKRLATKPSKGQKQKRLDTKKKISEKKDNRKFKF